jgi:hypothetical protein
MQAGFWLIHPSSFILHPSEEGGERDRSATLSFDRAQQKHPSPNRRSGPLNTNLSSPQGGPGGSLPSTRLISEKKMVSEHIFSSFTRN